MPPRLSDEIEARAYAFLSRRGGFRRGGRGRGGGPAKQGLYALAFGNGNSYATLGGGGEAGTINGFGTATLVQLGTDAIAGTANYFGHDGLSGSAGVGGYVTYGSAGMFVTTAASGGGSPAFTDAPRRQIRASDVGRIFLVVQLVDGSYNRQFIDRSEYLWGTALTTYTPPGAGNQTRIGLSHNLNSAYPTSSRWLASLTFRGVASVAQILDLYDRTRLLGDLPLALSAPSASSADIDALLPKHRFKMDAVTLSGGNLATLVNLGSAGGALSVAAGTIAAPAADALFNGQPTIALTGSQRLASTLPASAWSLLHNGSPYDVFVFWTPTADTSQYVLATDPGSATTQLGFVLSRATGGAIRQFAGNGSATLYDIQGGATPVNVATILQSSYLGSRAWVSRLSHLIAQGAVSNAPSASDSSGLVLGAGTTSAAPVLGKIAEILIFDRKLSDAETARVYDYGRSVYGIGVASVTHRWILRDVLRAAGGSVTSGQTGPAAIADSTTGAAGDLAARVSTPTVVTIDPSREGRRMLGALGWSAANYLATQPGAGISGGANGGHVYARVRVDSLTGAIGVIMERRDASPIRGMILAWNNGGAIDFNVYDSTNTARTVSYTVTSADLGQTLLVVGNLSSGTGGVMQLFVRRLQAGSDVAVPSYTAPSGSARTIFGVRDGGTLPLANLSVFGGGCGDTGLTAAEVLKLFDDLDAGRVPVVVGKTLHAWDFTQDELAAGETVPAQVLDRVGTDHLTRQGGLVVDGTGVRGFDGANWYQTGPGKGFRGAAGGCYFAIPIKLNAKPASTTSILCEVREAGATAYQIYWSSTSGLVFVVADGAGVAQIASYVIPDADIGVEKLYVLDMTGSAIRVFANRAQQASTPITGYAPPGATSPMMVGARAGGTLPAVNVTLSRIVGGNLAGGLSTAQMQALFDSYAAGALAPVTPGTDHDYNVKLDIVAGQAPGTILDRVGTDTLVRIGSGLTVAQRVERNWSWETSPLIAGVTCVTVNDYLQSAAALPIFSAAGGWLAVPITLTSLTVPSSAGRHIVSSALGVPNRGWAFYTTGANAALLGTLSNGTSFTPASFGSLTSADIGKTLLAFLVYDQPAGKLRTYLKRAEVGVGTSLSPGYLAGDGITRFGNGSLSAHPSEGIVAHGLMGAASAIPTLAEIQASHDAWVASDGDLARAAIPGKTDYVAQFRGQTSVPAQLAPSLGNVAFLRSGSPSLVQTYARAAGW